MTNKPENYSRCLFMWRKLRASTWSPVSLDRSLVTVSPALENALSAGADEAGTHKYFCASLNSKGCWALLPIHQPTLFLTRIKWLLTTKERYAFFGDASVNSQWCRNMPAPPCSGGSAWICCNFLCQQQVDQSDPTLLTSFVCLKMSASLRYRFTRDS